MQASISQLRHIAKSRGADLQAEALSMEVRGLSPNGTPKRGQQQPQEDAAVEIDIVNLRKRLQEEENSLRILEDEVKLAHANAGDGKRMDEFCVSNTVKLAEMNFQCSLCLKRFKGESFVNKHIRDRHVVDMLLGSPERNLRTNSLAAFEDADVPDEANAKMYTNKMSPAGVGVHQAAETGDLEKLQRCLRQGGQLNMRDQDGATPLHISAANEDPACMKYLLESAADVKATDDCKVTALHVAARIGHLSACEILISAGALLGAQDSQARRPLHLAAAGGHVDPCKALLVRRSEVNALDGEGATALHNAARFGDKDLCELILSWGAHVNAPDNDGWNPLHEAARWGDGELVTALLRRAADIHATSNDGETALHVVPGGYAELEVVEVLLSFGASPNAPDHDGETALHVAVKLGDETLVGILLDSGADANAKSKAGVTPLDMAKKDEIRWLLRSHKARRS